MKKYFLGLLFCALLVLGLVSATDVSAATAVHKMKVDGWARPHGGQPVTTNCTITIDGMPASEVTDYCEMYWSYTDGQIAEGTFAGGTIVELSVAFRLKSSYSLADDFYAIFGGGSTSKATWRGEGADCWIVYANYMCNIPISHFEITNVVEPVAGAHPVNTFTLSDTGVSINTSRSGWMNMTDSKSLSPDDTFEDGKKYRFSAAVDSKSFFYWPDDLSSISVTLNSNKVEVEELNAEGTHVVNVVFTCKKPKTKISDVIISGVTEPADGALPSTKLTEVSDHVTVDSATCWYNLTDDIAADTDKPFEGGKEYQFQVSLIPFYGYEWPESAGDVQVTINGQKANVTLVPSQNSCVAVVNFTCPKKSVEYSIYISKGTADVKSAVAGTKITIVAEDDTETSKFTKWIVKPGTDVTFADPESRTTSFIMPESEVALAAVFDTVSTDPEDKTPDAGASTGSDSETGTGSSDSSTTTDSGKSDTTTAAAPKKGDVIVSNTEKAIYKVTAVGSRSGKVGKVTYVSPTKSASKVTIKSTVTIDGIKYKVTAIASEAFKGNKKLEKLVVGKEIKTIGKAAFYGCTKLKSVELQGAYKIRAKAFCKCSKLTTIVINSKKLKSSTVGVDVFTKINSKAVVKVPSAKVSSYKKLFKKVGLTGSSQTVKSK